MPRFQITYPAQRFLIEHESILDEYAAIEAAARLMEATWHERLPVVAIIDTESAPIMGYYYNAVPFCMACITRLNLTNPEERSPWIDFQPIYETDVRRQFALTIICGDPSCGGRIHLKPGEWSK